MVRFIEHEMAIYDSKKDERVEMLKKNIASGFDSYVSMNLSCSFSTRHKIFGLGHNMCLFDVLQCKKVGISTKDGGVSTNKQKPNTHLMRPNHRDGDDQNVVQVRRKEVESVTDVVPLTSNSDDATLNVVPRGVRTVHHSQPTWVQLHKQTLSVKTSSIVWSNVISSSFRSSYRAIGCWWTKLWHKAFKLPNATQSHAIHGTTRGLTP